MRRRLGLVSSFAYERLSPSPKASATAQELFDAYAAWRKDGGRVALRNGHFREAMHDLAREVGIPLVQDGGNTVHLEVMLSRSE